MVNEFLAKLKRNEYEDLKFRAILWEESRIAEY
jgi:hypothetical protein